MARKKSRKAAGIAVAAPKDILEYGHDYASDGRKLEESEHVGAQTPDTDADSPRMPKRRS